jgi:predicted ATPase/DNA-binding winged helix-turn-helix (wHTH) protein
MESPIESATFGPFTLFPSERRLVKNGVVVPLGGRAMDLLIALLREPGAVLDKHDLLARVWPGIHVEESNLRTHISTLRKALGDGTGDTCYVISVAGRGYCFVAPVGRQGVRPSDALNNIPVQRSDLIGRDEFVRALVDRFDTSRVVTVVGPPGVGKTSVARIVAEQIQGRFLDGVVWVELGPISGSRRVPDALRDILNLKPRSDGISELISLMGGKRLLVVLDNCEHVIEGAAELVAAILEGRNSIAVLATSREPLRIDGEHVFLLPTLEVPPQRSDLTIEEAMKYAAVQLFAQRAAEASNKFNIAKVEPRDLSRICHRLDGLPLAIELVAGQATHVSVTELADSLTERLLPLASGRRSGPARQRALRAALEWSYDLLPADEKTAFRSLGTFSGLFTIEGAARLMDLDQDEAAGLISELLLKSLLQVEHSDTEDHFRLLMVTREFLLERLRQEDEYGGAARRHATYYCEYFRRAYGDFSSKPRTKWLPRYAPQLDNLRSALDWCFSADGDTGLGVELTINAVPFWMHMSLIEECQRRARQALSSPPEVRSDRQDLQLYAGLSAALLEYGGCTDDVLEKAIFLARKLQDTDYLLRALSMLWYFRLENAQFDAAFAVAREFSSTAAALTHSDDTLVADRMLAATLHILGEQDEALRYNNRVLQRYATAGRRSDIERFTIDQRVQAMSLQSSILWLRGLPDQSSVMARSAMADAIETGHAGSICSVLVHSACPLALFRGDLPEARDLAKQLLQLSSPAGLEVWITWGRCYSAILDTKTESSLPAIRALDVAIKDLEPWRGHPRSKILIFEYALALGRVGRINDGLAEIAAIVEQCDRTKEYVLFPELLRVKSELLALAQGPDDEQSHRHLARALSLARSQGVLSLELRAALSLNRLRPYDPSGFEVLRAAFSRFTEGWDTADLVLARQMLNR